MVEPLPPCLLGAHVVRRPLDRPRLVPLLGDLREAEIRQLRLVAGGQQHVGRLDVAVDHPLLVCVRRARRPPGADPEPLDQRQMLPTLLVARPVHLLHDEVVDPVRFPEVVEPDDVVVNQARQDLRLEADLPADLLPRLLLEHLDRHGAMQDLVGGPIDRPHAAASQLLLQGETLVQGRTDHRETPLRSGRGRGSHPLLRPHPKSLRGIPQRAAKSGGDSPSANRETPFIKNVSQKIGEPNPDKNDRDASIDGHEHRPVTRRAGGRVPGRSAIGRISPCCMAQATFHRGRLARERRAPEPMAAPVLAACPWWCARREPTLRPRRPRRPFSPHRTTDPSGRPADAARDPPRVHPACAAIADRPGPDRGAGGAPALRRRRPADRRRAGSRSSTRSARTCTTTRSRTSSSRSRSRRSIAGSTCRPCSRRSTSTGSPPG